MINCSACILTYNSEKTLKKCLESVKDFSDIVILDGGSIDETLEIAKLYNARVYPQSDDGSKGKISDFTEVRRKHYNMAGEDWIFVIDSDEYLSKEGQEKIKEITDNTDANKNNLYKIFRKAIINDKIIQHAFFYPDFGTRLWNKKADIKLRSNKKVHESMMAGDGVQIKNLDVAIYHYWHESYKELIKKDSYYLKIAMGDGPVRPIGIKLKKTAINILKAGNTFWKALRMYKKYGFKNTLPIIYSWRFVRYHLVFAKKVLFSYEKK